MFGPQYGFVSGTGGTLAVLGVTGTVQNFSAPPNAIGFFCSAEPANIVPVRMAIGSAANSTTGSYFVAQQSSDGFYPVGATISICGATTTVASTLFFNVQWITGS